MITKHDALTANEFHYGECTRTVGPRGGVTVKCEVWRRNGATKTWVTRPDAFRVPVKHGMRHYAYVSNEGSWSPVVNGWHTADDCPLTTPYVTTGRPPFGTGR